MFCAELDQQNDHIGLCVTGQNYTSIMELIIVLLIQISSAEFAEASDLWSNSNVFAFKSLKKINVTHLTWQSTLRLDWPSDHSAQVTDILSLHTLFLEHDFKVLGLIVFVTRGGMKINLKSLFWYQ